MLNGVQRRHAEWQHRNFPNQTPEQNLLGVGEELGELFHAHLKDMQGIRGPQLKHKIDAIGDMVLFLMSYCESQGIDLEAAILRTAQIVHQRDWVKFPLNGVSL